MHSKSLIAASVALLSSIVAADSYSGDGNVDMTVEGDGPIFIGTSIPSDVLDTLNQHCNAQTCDADSWTIDTSLTDDSAGQNSPTNTQAGVITVTVVDATISRDDDLPGMIEALKDLAQQPQIFAMKTEHYCEGDDGTTPPARFRRGKRDVTCNRDENPSIDQYSTSSTFYIRVNDDGGALRSEIRVKLEAGVVDDTLSMTLCSDLATAGSAVAGLFTGGAALAAGFSLGGLACGAL